MPITTQTAKKLQSCLIVGYKENIVIENGADMSRYRVRPFFFLVTIFVALFCVSVPSQTFAQKKQGGVSVIVNGNPITKTDIGHRKAFLRLQGRSGNLDAAAREDMIEEMLKRVEVKSRNIDIPQPEVDNAFAGFASRNGMSVAQLSNMLNQAGVTAGHFKTYIMVQMGWGRLVSARIRSETMLTEQDAVQRSLANGGVKPSTNEYRLQQIIFVVPANRRSAILGKRRAEANVLRSKINGCDNLRDLTKGMMDVTLRQPPRVLELELPDEWSKSITATPAGKATPPLDTPRGIEIMVVCSIRQTNDDRAARLIYALEDGGVNQKKAEAIERKYISELREKAKIRTP